MVAGADKSGITHANKHQKRLLVNRVTTDHRETQNGGAGTSSLYAQ